MNPQVLLWILGVAVMVLMAAIGFMVNWNRGQDTRMADMEKELSKLARHTAENYVRGHEIAEVKKMIGDLRTEFAHQIGELTKAVHQMIGQNNSKSD